MFYTGEKVVLLKDCWSCGVRVLGNTAVNLMDISFINLIYLLLNICVIAFDSNLCRFSLLPCKQKPLMGRECGRERGDAQGSSIEPGPLTKGLTG